MEKISRDSLETRINKLIKGKRILPEPQYSERKDSLAVSYRYSG